MSTKITLTLDEHDAQQLVLLAKLMKLKSVQTLIVKICRAHLDGVKPDRAP